MAEARVDRDTRLNIRVHQSVYDRMHALADQMGIAAATLGAVAISEYLARQEAQTKQQQVIATAMVNAMGPMLETAFASLNEKEIEEGVAGLLGARAKA